jgi:hypothetical protein
MGYYITIVENNLKCKKDISRELGKAFDEDEFYLNWQWENGYVGLDEYYFKWNSRFIRDLLILKDLNVRGYCTSYGEEGEYYKYVINRNGVKEFSGRVVYPKKPESIYKSKDDVKDIF